jgi:hypothetical protein
VFSHREASGEFVVCLGEAIAAAGEQAAPEVVVARYGQALEAAITAHPEQWTGWRTGSWSRTA